MSISVDAAIQSALYARLKELNLPKALPIAPEGKNYDGKGKPYLRPAYLPAEPDSAQLPDDGDVAHRGLYQIDVFWPAGQGIEAALEIADAVRAHYARGLRLFLDGVDLRVIRAPFTMPTLQEAAWVQIPVRVPWWACVSAPP